MRKRYGMWTGVLLAMLAVGVAGAQEKRVPKVVPVPPLPPPKARPGPPPEPTSPAAQTVEDARAHVTFRLPAGWNVSRRDGELSRFRLDARTAAKSAQMRVAASLNFNPFPQSTFSGALLYLSTAQGVGAAACAAQTTRKPEMAMASAVVGDVKFARGKDEHGHICTEARDIAYTAVRGGSCVRFDLLVNTFCGGEVSGAEDLTETQLQSVYKRMEGILETVRFLGR
jgi:hypothetical protein